ILDISINTKKKFHIEKRNIKFYITQLDSYFCIICENYFNGEIKEKDGKLLSTKQSTEFLQHGIGLTSIEEVIKRNNGTWHYQYTDCLFTVEIMIPNYP